MHASALVRTTGDYAIPGFADADHDPSEVPDPGEVEGVLPNSALKTGRFAGGVSILGESGYVGVAYSGYDTEYGVPGGHGDLEAGPGEPEEVGDVKIDLRQRRFDAESELRFGGSFVKGLTARFGVADYRHFELLEDENTGEREIETTFNNDEWEGRLELQHAVAETSTGALGLQLRNRNFEALGAEAFVPPSQTGQVALFLFEQFSFDPVGLQAGLRLERQNTTAIAEELDRDFTGVSASLGVILEATESISVVLNGARSAKLPSPEELYSNGPHLATLRFERGDPDLDQEIGTSLDVGIRVDTESVGAELTVFANSFDRFIYQAATGEVEADLPVSQWSQSDAAFRGVELQSDVEVLHAGDGHIVVDGFADYVWAKLVELGESPPRIPPFRLGAGVGYESTALHGRVGVTRFGAQNRVSSLETPTAGYTMLEARVGVRLFKGRTVHDVVLSGTNLLDQEARSHTSFLKQFAPLPGRDVRLTYQLSF
jgi:iron complex outermembrane receptor protein